MSSLIQLVKANGDVKEVCQSLANLTERFKGWTVGAILRYLKIVEAEREQFGGEVDAERRY